MSLPRRRCVACKKLFTPWRRDQKACGKKCSNAYHHAKRAERRNALRLRPMCRVRAAHEGEPARDVLLGYARLGYSQRLVASLLAIGPVTLRKYCRRLGIQWPGRGEQNAPWGGQHYRRQAA